MACEWAVEQPRSALPTASREESLLHYPASITHPHGSTELKEIFYDAMLHYVLLKAEHRPPLPHSSEQRLCWAFFIPPSQVLAAVTVVPKASDCFGWL